MLHNIAKSLLITLVIAGVLITGGLWGGYLYGIHLLPRDRTPSKIRIPYDVAKTLWVSETRTTSMVMSPLSPVDVLINLVLYDKGALPPSTGIASDAAMLLLYRNRSKRICSHDWQFEWTVATIWVSRNWTAEESVSMILAQGYFGNDFHGIQQASLGYFGVSPDGLSLSDAAILAGLIHSPQIFDPWCHPGRAFASAEKLVEQVNAKESFTPKLLPAPTKVCVD